MEYFVKVLKRKSKVDISGKNKKAMQKLRSLCLPSD